MRNTEDIRDKIILNWLRKGTLKKEIEGTITAAQDQALITNTIKNKIDKQEISPMCRMCGERKGNDQSCCGRMQKARAKTISVLAT